ncbi:hypothetical protein EIP91_007974 [Steccherinum ochraceum]|uniref:F-box domain-containing protein n=1 Tax=Steccherinum ochraceum TaxID=92696 RepID=A0A4R0RDP0_9APHY|nr:hypothetical protein EIP91_007974 [Steccherinum ochraceum]
MHHALEIDEILQTILQYFTLHDDDYSARHRIWKLRICRRTLAYLARTCKALSNSALDTLWERQSSLMPVLKLFPTFQTVGKGQYDFVAPIEPEHWQRFLSYSRRIQTFSFSADGRLLPAVYERVFRASDHPILFPALQRMIWSRNCPIDEGALLAFVSPSLRIADIQSFGVRKFISQDPTNSEDRNVLDALLHSLSELSLQLEDLKIGVQLTPTAERIIPTLHSIQALDLSMAGSWRYVDSFYALGRMQNLTELHISMLTLHMEDDVPPGLFKSLRTLYVWGAPATVGSVLRVVASNQLRVLQVKAGYSYPLEEWRECLASLPPRLADSLIEFRLECMRGLHSLSDTAGHIMCVAAPMMSCPNLEKVAFDLEGPLHASDADVRQMVAAWEKLREFRLWFHKSGEGPTLQSLVSCADLCSDLCELELSVDARTALQSPPAQIRPSLTRLAFLGNAKITVGQGETVGKYIHHLFPNLRDFDVYAWAAEENETWVTAKKNIPTLSAMHNESGYRSREASPSPSEDKSSFRT